MARIKFLRCEILTELRHPSQREGWEAETVFAPVDVEDRLFQKEVTLWDV